MKQIDKRYQLLALQTICHIALIAALWTFTGIDWAIAFAVYFITGCIGVTVTLHRHLSHRSFAFRNEKVKKFFVACSSWGIIGDPISWVNTHRHHHRYTDHPGDPHSPLLYGFARVQWLSMFNTPRSLRLVPDLIRDKYLVTIHKWYYTTHWLIMITLLLIDVKLAMVIYLVPAAILWNAGSLINNAGHALGYRNHNTNDSSRNNPALGYAVWGEGWHNNHHNMPSKSKFGEKWWELDIGHHVISAVALKESIR